MNEFEKKFMQLKSKGFSYRRIAEILKISERSSRRIYARISIDQRTEEIKKRFKLRGLDV